MRLEADCESPPSNGGTNRLAGQCKGPARISKDDRLQRLMLRVEFSGKVTPGPQFLFGDLIGLGWRLRGLWFRVTAEYRSFTRDSTRLTARTPGAIHFVGSEKISLVRVPWS